MMEREKEMAAAIRQLDAALVELMACSADLLNSRLGKPLYEQCHSAVMNANRVMSRGLVGDSVTPDIKTLYLQSRGVKQ